MRLIVFAVCIFFASVTGPAAVEPGAPQELIGRDEAIRILIRKELGQQLRYAQSKNVQDRYKGMLAFYMAREGAPLWLNGETVSLKVAELRDVFDRAGDFGMNPNDYSAPMTLDIENAEYPAERLAKTEIAISLNAVNYAVHARSGRFEPQEISEFLDPSPDRPDAAEILKGLEGPQGRIQAHLESFHPQHPQFKALQAELLKTEQGAETDSTPSLPGSGPSIVPGDQHPDVAILREILGAPLPRNGEPADYYDGVLADAVRAFQERSRLMPDGIVGPATRNAFYMPPAPNKDILIANMERWRWFPRNLGKTHVRVNIPEYTVRVAQGTSIIFEERIVVGKPENQTPVFSDAMETVVINPYWHVPGSITVNEIMPLVRRNPGYLERNNLQVFIQGQRRPLDPYWVDWDRVDPRRLYIRQPPGDDNALGQLKFLFPNKHAVYMHDTPTKHLFNRSERAYSHGCMRVRNPRNFAEVILRSQGWPLSRIERTIDSGTGDLHIAVAPKIPVHIMYFTLWVDETGTLRRFRDIYGHDERVLSALKTARS